MVISDPAQYILNVVAQEENRGMSKGEALESMQNMGLSMGMRPMAKISLEKYFNEAVLTCQISERDGKFYSTESYKYEEDFTSVPSI